MIFYGFLFLLLLFQPLMIVPAGKEPAQLLHLFKGKFVIHSYAELKVYYFH